MIPNPPADGDNPRPLYPHVSRAVFLTAMLVLAAASVALRAGATPDVSWLITTCERMLNGERPYVDIVETTPPVPMLLYMPGALVAKFIGGTSEAATFAFAYASAFGSLWLAARILPDRLSDGVPAWVALTAAAVVLFVVPSDAFAQREYFAAAFALPMAAVFIRHADVQSWPPLTDRALAALLGGLTIAVKPPLFALPGVLVCLYYWTQTRSLSFLLPSGLVAAAAIGLAVTAASLAAFPDYLRNMSGIMSDVYVPIRGHISSFVHDRACLGVLACLGITFILSLRSGAPAATISAVVAGGFLLVYFIQGKYFPYHVFPAALFSALAACVVVLREMRRLRQGPFAAPIGAAGIYGLAACMAAVPFVVGFADGRPVMRDLTWATTLSHPRALAVSPVEDTSFPLARQIGAIWVGHTHSEWVARYTRFALTSNALTPDEKARWLAYHRSDLEAVLRDIRGKRPEIIIEDMRPIFSWLVPELNALQPGFLDDYRILAEEGPIRVLRRR
jgi:hypothetical protein